MFLYRYARRRYNDALVSRGEIRIGTLHDFRRSEHGRGIADGSEGRKTVTNHVRDYVIADSRQDERVQELRMFGVNVAGENITIRNSNFSNSISAPNAFILCASSRNDAATRAQFEGAETCVEISDPEEFARTLTPCLSASRPVHFLGWHPVRYQPRAETFNGRNLGLAPELIKDPAYSRQYEWRAIWRPDPAATAGSVSMELHPCNLSCEGIRRFVRHVEVGP